MKYLLTYLLILNAAGFFYMLADKRKARKKLWRIPERRLIGIALLGGSGGVLLGMHLARHKTKHPKFSIGVPIIFAVQVVFLIFLFFSIFP